MALSAQAKALLDMVYRVGAPRFHELTVAQARHSFHKLQFAFGAAPQPVASTTEVPMPRADGSALLARLYRPLTAAADDLLPLVIYLHGGGWCIGDVGSYDPLCRQLANASECSVLSVEYRLAPEHPFPAAIEDALFATEWAWENAALLGAESDRIALAGDSAGGNLAIVTALLARDRGSVPIRYMALIYPSTEMQSTRASRERFGQGYFLDRESLVWFIERYLPLGGVEDWRASPMRVESLAGLPPVLLVTAECDPLTDDCLAFSERVRLEGGEVEHLGVEGMVHGFITLGKLFPEAEAVVTDISRRLRNALGENARS